MTLLRIEDGIPWVGDRSYPWAVTVNDDSFALLTENAWRVCVSALDDPSGCIMVVAYAEGLHESWDARGDGSWQYGTPFNWSFPVLLIGRQQRFEEILAQVTTMPSPVWLQTTERKRP